MDKMNQQKIYADMQGIANKEHVFMDKSLKEYTYTKTGGKADVLVFPEKPEEVQQIVRYAYTEAVPITIIGNGSNLLIKDGGIRGITLMLTELKEISIEEQKITAQCGAAIIDVSREATKNSLAGLEFACGIPGTVGGALYMNAGAYGGEISEVLESALILTEEGNLLRMNGDELGLNYRSSLIAKKNYVVLEAVFALQPGDYTAIKAKTDELTYLRELKQPLEYPSCGSVFKRPPNHFGGKLIQDAGLQKTRIGGAEVSEKHAGFIVNVDNATSTDYINLIRHIQKTVKQTFNVELETEVKIIGEDVLDS